MGTSGRLIFGALDGKQLLVVDGWEVPGSPGDCWRHRGGLQGLLSWDKVLQRLAEQSIEDVGKQGSTALRGTKLRSVGLVAPFSDVMKLLQFSLRNLDIFF